MKAPHMSMSAYGWRKRLLEMARLGLIWTGDQHETMRTPIDPRVVRWQERSKARIQSWNGALHSGAS